MPLDNTASIKEIITSLQSMEGINAKADLASVIGEPAQSSDTMATMVNHIQTAKNELATKMGDSTKGTDPLQSLVGDLVTGKKWASGIVTSSSSVLTFQSTTGDSSAFFTKVTGIGFTPSTIILQRDAFAQMIAVSTLLPQISGYHLIAMAGTMYRLNGNAYIGNGEFQLPVGTQATTYNWIAFE